MFNGGIGCPRLLINPYDLPSDIDHAESIAQMAMKQLAWTDYYWCGLFNDDDTLAKEWTFGNEVVIK